jgi:hypothetical protein
MAQDFVLNRSMYRDAYSKGLTLSALLENMDPSSKYNAGERAQGDAFQRQLARLDVRTTSVPEAGIGAHSWERFWDNGDGLGDERAVLAPEWLSRQYRQAARVIPRTAGGVQFADAQRILSTNAPLSDVLWPSAQDGMMRYQQIEPSLLSYMVGRTRTIDSDTFKAFYLADTATQASAHMKRVGEYGSVPAMRITGSDQAIHVQKYGRKLQASYEAMRRMSLDLISWAVRYIAAVADNDKFLHALDVLVNGDGNSGTAATNTNGSTLDAAAGGVQTLKMWLGWGMLWRRPHQANVVIGRDAAIVSLLLLNAGSANIPPSALANAAGAVGQISLARPIYGGMVAINEATAPANKLVGFDNRYTLEMVMEAGSNIVETDRIIGQQYEEVVLTETLGWDIMTLGQNRTLAYTA